MQMAHPRRDGYSPGLISLTINDQTGRGESTSQLVVGDAGVFSLILGVDLMNMEAGCLPVELGVEIPTQWEQLSTKFTRVQSYFKTSKQDFIYK